jgi:hypothetical protein
MAVTARYWFRTPESATDCAFIVAGKKKIVNRIKKQEISEARTEKCEQGSGNTGKRVVCFTEKDRLRFLNHKDTVENDLLLHK